MSFMRKLVLFLMIALLAVRGWAGAVMSVEMSVLDLMGAPAMAANANPGGSASTSDDTVAERDSADCPDHAAMQTAGDAAADGGSHCNTCVACQICHTVALTGITPLKLAPLGADSPIALGVTRFASVALASGFKPPIS
jgi:hypothetical protein